MQAPSLRRSLGSVTADAMNEAIGRRHREDPVLPGTGGPAGNARLTAWTGLLLLALFIAEVVTLLDIRGLISWHIVIGVLLVPPALLKTGSTGWRILRYYTRDRPYRNAGPPPTLLRILGPLVVISTLAVLGSGLALIAAGPDASRRTLLQTLGLRVDAVTIHQVTFIIWGVATGLHTLARLLPALRLTASRQTAPQSVPGRYRRAAIIAATLMVAAAAAIIVLGAAAAWRSQPPHHFAPPPGRHTNR